MADGAPEHVQRRLALEPGALLSMVDEPAVLIDADGRPLGHSPAASPFLGDVRPTDAAPLDVEALAALLQRGTGASVQALRAAALQRRPHPERRPFVLDEDRDDDEPPARMVLELRLVGDDDDAPLLVRFIAAAAQTEGLRAYAILERASTSRRTRIAEAESLLSQALEAFPDATFIIDASGRITAANAAATKVFGYRRSELIGRDVTLLMPAPHAQRHQQYIDRFLETRHPKIIGRPRELTAIDNTGTEIPIRLAVGALEFGDQMRFVGSVYDLREVRELEQQLRQTQKMEALGRLAAGVAHDFNNLLAVVLQDAAVLERDTTSPATRTLAAEIATAGNRAKSLSRQLLQFSRHDVGHPEDVNLVDLAQDFVLLAARLLPESHQLELEFVDDVLGVHIDPGQLELVLLNLTINARDAMRDGGPITLRLSCGTLPDQSAYAQLEVRDRGDGVPESVQHRLFDPFFTTKPRGHGTGLGLSTALGIVERAGGEVTLAETSRRGSVFRVRLPLVDIESKETEPPLDERQASGPSRAPAPGAPAVARRSSARGAVTEHPPSAPAARPAARVLLVEDDSLVRNATARWLERAGHHVESHERAREALAALDRANAEILVTDLVMPGMNGMQLARAVARQQPSLPVVFVSGHAEDLLDDFELADNHRFLPKPFDPDELVALIDELLPTPP